jgi:hypothetical protein
MDDKNGLILVELNKPLKRIIYETFAEQRPRYIQ